MTAIAAVPETRSDSHALGLRAGAGPADIDSSSDRSWRPLYAVGAACAVLMLVLVPVAGVAFAFAPPSRDAASAFSLFERSSMLGLLSLDLVYMIEIVLAAIVLLAICVALRRASPSLVALALFFVVTSTAIYFASNPAFDMLGLSARYARAVDGERAALIAAGEAALARYTGTAYDVSYVMAGIGGLLLAIVMCRSVVFSKLTAYLGIVMGVLALVPPTAGKLGYYAAIIYLLPFSLWSVLIARRLYVLARGTPMRATRPRPVRAHLAGWSLLPFVAVLNGFLRDFTYGKALSTTVAHSLSVIPLIAAILAWSAFLARRRPLPSDRSAASVGLSWLVLTVAFEAGLGVVTGASTASILAQYDVTRGNLWVFVPLATACAPVLAHRLIRPSRCVAGVVAG